MTTFSSLPGVTYHPWQMSSRIWLLTNGAGTFVLLVEALSRGIPHVALGIGLIAAILSLLTIPVGAWLLPLALRLSLARRRLATVAVAGLQFVSIVLLLLLVDVSEDGRSDKLMFFTKLFFNPLTTPYLITALLSTLYVLRSWLFTRAVPANPAT